MIFLVLNLNVILAGDSANGALISKLNLDKHKARGGESGGIQCGLPPIRRRLQPAGMEKGRSCRGRQEERRCSPECGTMKLRFQSNAYNRYE
jgi:hypothetical protein